MSFTTCERCAKQYEIPHGFNDWYCSEECAIENVLLDPPLAPPADPVVEKCDNCGQDKWEHGLKGRPDYGSGVAYVSTDEGRIFCPGYKHAEPHAVSERADGWIPVDERQPDSDRLIWVMEQFGDGGEFTNFESTWGFYRKGKWLSYSHGELGESDHVRFWQEAPVPTARETIQSQ